MANYNLGLSYSVVDSHGVTGLAHFWCQVADTLTLAQVNAIWVALGTLLDGATDGKIKSGRVTFLQVADGGWKANAAAGSDASMAGVLQFSAANTTHQITGVVPALIEAAQTTGRVDINQTALKAFIYGAYHGFGAGSAYKITDTAGNLATGINRGFLGTRKHRKQQQSKTMTDGSGFVPPA